MRKFVIKISNILLFLSFFLVYYRYLLSITPRTSLLSFLSQISRKLTLAAHYFYIGEGKLQIKNVNKRSLLPRRIVWDTAEIAASF